jgi:hypothetical protein
VYSGWATFLCDEGFCVLPRDSLWLVHKLCEESPSSRHSLLVRFILSEIPTSTPVFC